MPKMPLYHSEPLGLQWSPTGMVNDHANAMPTLNICLSYELNCMAMYIAYTIPSLSMIVWPCTLDTRYNLVQHCTLHTVYIVHIIHDHHAITVPLPMIYCTKSRTILFFLVYCILLITPLTIHISHGIMNYQNKSMGMHPQYDAIMIWRKMK